ncbi:hypothetical protein E1295_23150 [Nonomuraea mesophila]|uniref:Uncharacterized protein n=1 Tax=Nonomuraea mesophila TaxID=2530382 RepID=A0A4R5FBX4_9ACTN|nr:hypothetical protein [Nonomuraea mesophila]TDE46457.1 hypothetical protein E1295_23150 [Nonomuraea mesophila]
MSHKRSGLLSGLIVGLLAGLICAAGLGAAVLLQESLPSGITTFGNGLPLPLALSLVIALVVAFAMGAVRPRAFTLAPFAALYAGGAVAAGQIAGLAIMISSAQREPGRQAPAGLSDITLPAFTEGLPGALALYRDPLTQTWPAWLYIAVAALAALVLVALRVTRVRRSQRAQEAQAQAEAEAEEAREPEYRAPFEPAQAPAPKPTTDLFTPRKPARD